ncbi:MAG: two-component sensor histidine kinase, partial [Burkholderiales bacterium]|nr:two-component sensor histidine kinase [Burkholderiales bacterium]
KKVTVEINDTGAGIAQEDLPHIFNRFYRGDKSRRQHTGNAGLGLAIVKSILGLHGSEIDVTSSRGEGASFRFALPVAEGAARPHREAAALL